MKSYFTFFLIFVITSSFLLIPASATNVYLDKPSYFFGDQISVSGNVVVVEGQFIGLQILNPFKSDIVTIDQFLPNGDGTFSKKYKAQGPKWHLDGDYTIKIVYNEEISEKTFQFQNIQSSDSSKPEKSSETSSSTKQQTTEMKITHAGDTFNPKLLIEGFPDPNVSPNYYFDRYYNEHVYKDWFDEVFPEFSIEEVAGYKTTRIPDFPDNQYSPRYYVDRYNQEEQFKDWFDSQFKSTSIYEVLGFPESIFQKVPDWVKNNAKWWSSGLINDADFLYGIEYLINENIILIPNLPESEISVDKTVPSWIKNTAKWWSDGQIDENEFLKGITFLIENGIIIP